MTAAYIRELTHAARDSCELTRVLVGDRPVVETPVDLTLNQLMQAIGLARMTHDALVQAANARQHPGAGTQP